jgi:hypothetical protein
VVVVALAFWFVAVCPIEDRYSCEEYSGPYWYEGRGGYDVVGPYFTREDCLAARTDKPVGDKLPDGSWRTNPWSPQGESECYAREIRVAIP